MGRDHADRGSLPQGEGRLQCVSVTWHAQVYYTYDISSLLSSQRTYILITGVAQLFATGLAGVGEKERKVAPVLRPVSPPEFERRELMISA